MGSPEAQPQSRYHASPAVTAAQHAAVGLVIGGTASRTRPSRLTVAPRSAVVARQAEVTTEELRILALLANGLATDSVAARVAMSPRTVRRRLRCVCDRLGVVHPIQAVVWAVRRGLL